MSSDHLNIVDATGARIEPPPGLRPEELEEWHKIVDSLPADFFRPGDVPLLETFVSAAALWREAKKIVHEEKLLLMDAKGRKYVNPAQQVMVNQASAMAQMAVKLRLCPSARYSEKQANTKTDAGSTESRPWYG